MFNSDALKVTLNHREEYECNPIISISETDSRIPSLSFASLGKMHQAGGLIWSGVAPINMSQQQAEDYCKSLGARLPTKEELEALSRAKGYQVPGRKFDSGSPIETKGRWFWSGSVDDSNNNLGFYLNKPGDILSDSRSSRLSALCVH